MNIVVRTPWQHVVGVSTSGRNAEVIALAISFAIILIAVGIFARLVTTA